MSGILNSDILEALNKANFEKITNYILSMCELVVEDYEKRRLMLPNDENSIRSIMLEDYLSKQKSCYGMTDYRFDLEVPENYNGEGRYVGRIDIRIILKSDFEKEDAYYIVECKRIDGTSSLNKKYVNDGIARFITEKYSSYYGRNIMLGFLVKKVDIEKNVKLIEEIQNSALKHHVCGELGQIKSGRNTQCYSCTYQVHSGKLELYHIFADYSNVVQ